MTTARLSIIIPTYNYANTLERAVLSVCKQMDEETEVIIVNDGSTDNTADVLLSLQQKLNDKIKVFDKMNGGAASARNLGIVNSTGDYFIFLDADDEMAENGINQIREHLKQHNSSKFIIGGHTSVFPSGKRKLHKPSALPAQPIAKLKAYLIDKTLSLSNGACLMHKSILMIWCTLNAFGIQRIFLYLLMQLQILNVQLLTLPSPIFISTMTVCATM